MVLSPDEYESNDFPELPPLSLLLLPTAESVDADTISSTKECCIILTMNPIESPTVIQIRPNEEEEDDDDEDDEDDDELAPVFFLPDDDAIVVRFGDLYG